MGTPYWSNSIIESVQVRPDEDIPFLLNNSKVRLVSPQWHSRFEPHGLLSMLLSIGLYLYLWANEVEACGSRRTGKGHGRGGIFGYLRQQPGPVAI